MVHSSSVRSAFGYALTMCGVLRAGVDVSTALKVAPAAGTGSITVMEIIDNAVMLAVPGAVEAGMSNWVFWASLATARAVAFVLTVPINRWLISRGKGHAVVRQYHTPMTSQDPAWATAARAPSSRCPGRRPFNADKRAKVPGIVAISVCCSRGLLRITRPAGLGCGLMRRRRGSLA
jgi:hypothetical protein